MKINVHCVFDETTKNYAEYMCKVALQLANQPTQLSFFSHKPRDERRSSWTHGSGLISALTMCDRSTDINVIADSDTVLLKRGWDIDVYHVLKQYHCLKE